MADVKEIKARLMNAACMLAAAAAVESTPKQEFAPDPLIKDVNLQSENLFLYEEAKVFYAALVRAHEDTTGVWPDPKLPEPAPAKNPVAGVLGAVAGVLPNIVAPGSELQK